MVKIYYFLIANIIISLFHIFTLLFLIKKSGGKITVEKVASSAKDAAKAVAEGLGITCVKDVVDAAHAIFGKGKIVKKVSGTDRPKEVTDTDRPNTTNEDKHQEQQKSEE